MSKMKRMADWRGGWLVASILINLGRISNGHYGMNLPEKYDNTGDMNDGNWWCSWRTSGGECWDGHFNCRCPGTGAEVWFTIGCCYEFPACGVICNQHDCSRFYNCNECRGETGEWSSNSCLSCQEGYVLGNGDCKEDFDECGYGNSNGGCDQVCDNSYGSYSCRCYDGFRLLSDQHSCERLQCSDPGGINYGTATPTDNWMYASYVKYGCNNHRTLLGYSVRKCQAAGESLWWQGEQPDCVDTCENVPLEQRRQCGGEGVTLGQCRELGCCYSTLTGAPSCFKNPVPMYLLYGGDRPSASNGDGYENLEEYTPTGCALKCSTGSSLRCKAYGIRRTGYDATHDVMHQTCNLQEKSRKELRDNGELSWGDVDYDFYDQLFFSESQHSRSIISTPGKFYLGCYTDDASQRDLEFHVWTKTHNTPARCIMACRQHGYSFAGLQGGSACYCGNGVTRLYDESDQCNAACSGDDSQTCGGSNVNSVFSVPSDSRYLGCYNDVTGDSDLSDYFYGEQLNLPASRCITECQKAGYLYAGVQNGGRCYCGNSFGRHGDADESNCTTSCTGGWVNENCGGYERNAIYTTNAGVDLTSNPVYDTEITKLYVPDESLRGIPLMLFSEYPKLKSIITKRLILHATEAALTPADDPLCTNDCYRSCGQIYQPDGLTYRGESLTLRFLFLDLADLDKYVGVDSTRVFVYAETVLIKSDLNFRYALQIRTRQLIINRSAAKLISVGASAPLLDVDFDLVKEVGPFPDYLFQRQSFMCARILLDSRLMDNVNTAAAILYDLAQQSGKDVEQSDWSSQVRMFNAYLNGIDRDDIRFVPFYSKSYFTDMLTLYYDRIWLYNYNYNRLLDQSVSDNEYIRLVEEMLFIQATTDVAEAQSSFDASLTVVDRSNATYYRMKGEYDNSVAETEEARVVFEAELERKVIGGGRTPVTIAKAVLDYVGAMKLVYKGLKFIVGKIVQNQLEEALKIQLDMLADSMENLALAVEETDRLMRVSDEVIFNLKNPNSNYDYSKVMADIEIAAEMQVNIVRWINLKSDSQVILSNPAVYQIDGCPDYLRATLNLCNWGEALTRSSVEHAEVLRDCIQKKYTLDGKNAQMERYDEYLQSLKSGAANREIMTSQMAEQQYDVRLDLNNILMSFCQAFFYENMYECKDSYKPSFGGSMSDLLIKINAALMDSILIPNPPSTVSRIVRIQDTDLSEDCNDFVNCPIRYFRQTGILYYNLPINHPSLIDMDNYRVYEIVLDFVGAKPNQATGNQVLKARIEASGSFQGRDKGVIYNFLTRALSLTFEYDIVTYYISWRADVYEPYQGTVQHITPFTTWVIRLLSDANSGVDISQVTQVTMRFDGSANDNEPLQPEIDEADDRD